KTRKDISKDRKSAPWKVALAASLKQSTQVTNRWLSVELCMGTPVAASAHVGRMNRGLIPAAAKSQRQLKTLNVKS
ncbi:MAG TPA: hypothetical protein VL069_16230, partial [Opitutus sp.]|nr:hypothetical protein [Opitutus sp.]